MYCSHQYLSIDSIKVCHAYFNAHKPPKPVTPTIFMLDKKFYLKCIGLVNNYRLIQNKFATPTLTPITFKSVYRR